MKSNKPSLGLSFQYFKEDLPAGLVVFFVALPLCLGIALASGAPLFSGIISGIIGGIVVASFSGSALSVSGPAAGLTVIVFNGIADVGSFEAFLLALAFAGVIQFVLGYIKAGVIGYYFPSSVIKGMLAAIGIILILKQAPIAIGYVKGQANSFQIGAIVIAVVSMLVLLVWEIKGIKKYAFFKWVPGALVAVILGIVGNELFKIYQPSWVLNNNFLVSLPVAKSSSEFMHQFTLPDFSAFANYKVYLLAVTIAIIASLETLLSVEAADKLDPFKRLTPTNRELMAQGAGNFLSGMLGGLPMTAVIVRTSANINAGGKTKLSAIIHGILLLISVIGLSTVLNKIPLACLAAVLLLVGYKLTKVSLYKQMFKLGWEQFLPFIITIIAIQFSDLLKGIFLGVGVSIFFILRSNHKRDYTIHHEPKSIGGHVHIKLAESVTFINKGSIAKKLADLPNDSIVKIDGSGSHFIDIDVLEILHDFKQSAILKNIQVELVKIPAFQGISAH
jgi:MFS superfamily sulfate permease-like transporter